MTLHNGFSELPKKDHKNHPAITAITYNRQFGLPISIERVSQFM